LSGGEFTRRTPKFKSGRRFFVFLPANHTKHAKSGKGRRKTWRRFEASSTHERLEVRQPAGALE
jgi:hypothetical protein